MPPSQEHDRFAPPKACVTALPRGGTSYMGLPDKNGKTILKHSFEASKAQKNDSDLEASMQIPVGQRHDALRDFEQRLFEKRMNYDDWKRPNRNPSREHLTSSDNPLQHLHLFPQTHKEPPVQSIKTYPRNTHMATMSHIDTGSLTPLTKAEVRAARASAKRASREVSPSRQRPGTSGSGSHKRGGARQQQQGGGVQQGEGEGSQGGEVITEGSEEGQEEEEGGSLVSGDEEGDDLGELGHLSCSEKEEMRNAMLKSVEEEIKKVKEVEDQLIREYPHGVPRIVIMRMQQELGVRLPSLGFGEAQSLSDKVARASLRM